MLLDCISLLLVFYQKLGLIFKAIYCGIKLLKVVDSVFSEKFNRSQKFQNFDLLFFVFDDFGGRYLQFDLYFGQSLEFDDFGGGCGLLVLVEGVDFFLEVGKQLLL